MVEPEIPKTIHQHIQAIVYRDTQPAYFYVSPNGNLLSWGGELEHFGIQDLNVGDYIGDAVYYLDGLFPIVEEMHIPAMMTDTGRYADLHIVAVGEGACVVLIDVTESTEQKQVVQQKGNEMSLLTRQLEVRNRFIKQTFGRYLSDEIVEQILDTPDGMNLSGETRRVTILMNDLRGFTSMCERLAPDQVVTMLNNFLGAMTDVILKYQGTIDEFIGDAILVIFGAPIQRDDDALRAVACATEMMLAMEQVNQFNREHDLPEVEMGIGLNTGDVIVGNIGSDQRLKYGVVGSNVNLTARVESYTVGGQILASQNTIDDAGADVEVKGQMEVSPKGVQEPMTIYDIRGVRGEYDVVLPESDETVEDLATPATIEYQVLDGKHADAELQQSSFVGLSNRGATLDVSTKIELKSNVKIQVLDANGDRVPGDLYAKAVPGPAGENLTYLRFTSMPPVLDQYLQNLETVAGSQS